MSAAQWKKDLAFTAGILRKKPFSLLIQVTNRCNMECSFCDFWPNPDPKRELTVDDFKRISRELAELGTFGISIEGGEPTLRKDLPEIIAALSEHHLTSLYTNGWFITREYAKRLFDCGLLHANVSIDYPDAARHDGKRRLSGTTDKAWQAVDIFRDVAPRKGKQVQVMTVLMESNWRDMEKLLQQSQEHGVGHQVTLLSISGFRRGKDGPDKMPPPEASEHMEQLWKRYPHLRFFREYFRGMGSFLRGDALPTCNAGVQQLNIDHVGNVSPCIEHIDRVVGNVRDASLVELHRRLVARADESRACQDCWTACRGMAQAIGGGGSVGAFLDLSNRMRST
jgi:MoaA/NifB/PqqE/SkfB family radical SAM enzyme